jgi:tRNA G18 (ribose-2'-O)-methylase SpoU
MKLKPKILRKFQPSKDEVAKIQRNPIYIVLDRVLDTYNIGSIFRLADAIAASKIYICGDSDYPPSSRIHKAAVGTENWVPWEKHDSTYTVVNNLREKGVQIIAVEQNPNSINYKYLTDKAKFPCAIVVGNETTGISNDVLMKSDIIVELPMLGINHSFNVWGSAAIVAYKILELID